MSFVADIQSNQHRGDLFNDASVLQLSTIQRANSRNFARQLANPLSRVFVIAADDHITIDWAVLLEKVSGEVMKRGYNCYALRNKFRRLLRRRALPHAESVRGFASDARSQRDSGVYKYLSGTQRRLDVLQGLSVRFKRNRQHNDFGIAARESVLGARYLFIGPGFLG